MTGDVRERPKLALNDDDLDLSDFGVDDPVTPEAAPSAAGQGSFRTRGICQP